MASFNGFSTNAMGFSARTSNLAGSPTAAVGRIGAVNNNRGASLTTFVDVSIRKGSRKGYTPMSPVYIIDVLQIKSPRAFPLETAWKKAATS